MAVVFLAIAGHTALAQSVRPSSLPVTVHGQVRFAHGAIPAENVRVRLERFSGGLEAELMTDRTGKFRFSGMVPAQYVLTVHLPGFREEQRQIDLQTTTSDYVLFQLMPEKNHLGGTTTLTTKILDANVPVEAQKEFERGQAVLQSDRQDRLEQSIRHLERAVTIYPKFLEAQLKLGTVYMDLNQWEKAEQTLLRALEIKPGVPNALFALGELNLQQRRYAEAEKMLLDGLRIENRSWQGHFTLARVYWNKGNLPKAGRQVALTLQLNPNLADAHLLGANILLRVGKREDALGEFEEYLRLAPHGEYSAQVRQTTQKIRMILSEKK
jgi:Tfp pilus assembly protein PilF